MISHSVRIDVWASQLAADDFPPVCVFSGEPADAWWSFRPFTTYRWASPFLLLLLLFVIGFVVTGPLGYLLARRAKGHLPMKAKYARRLSMVTWISAAILGFGLVIGAAGWFTPVTMNIALDVAGVLMLFVSLPLILLGAVGVQIGLQVAWNPLAPRGRVRKKRPGDPDRRVEISNVHPAFVAATLARYSGRSADSKESK